VKARVRAAPRRFASVICPLITRKHTEGNAYRPRAITFCLRSGLATEP
jgi:hypothetical protein